MTTSARAVVGLGGDEMIGPGSWQRLLGRRCECDRLSSLVAAAEAGRGQALVLRGEAGIGKTALLEFLVQRGTGCRLARAVGIESEMGLPFAGLHQVCGPYLDRLDQLPVAQRTALATTFGVQGGNPPDRFLVGSAVLTLLRELADERPLICVVDDAQWLDHESAETLAFVSHRVTAEPMATVFAVREPCGEPELAGLPELRVRGLGVADAAALLDSAVPGTLDPRVRDRVLAESRGNPLALLEVPRELPAAELAFGGIGPTAAPPLVHRLEEGFLRRLRLLPEQSRQLLLIAAAEPVGDRLLLAKAAERLGIGAAAAVAAEAGGWIELGDRIRFRHPLVRSAVYRSATSANRRAAHRALADVTDPDVDPDRRAWHRARAAVAADEAVAAELEQSAGRAAFHGGIAAAAAFLERAAALTPDPARGGLRSLEAGSAKASAGAFDDALALLAVAEAGPLDEIGRARIELLRGQISFNSSRGNDALPLLLSAARRLEPLDPRLAREAYVEAMSAALSAGRLAPAPGRGLRAVAEAARRAPSSEAPTTTDRLLEAMAVLGTEGYSASAPLLHRAVRAFCSEDLTLDEAFRGAWLAAMAAVELWDDVHWEVLSRRHLAVVRTAGALSLLPLALASRAIFDIHAGDLSAAASLVAESQWVAEVTDGENALTPIPQAWLEALRGHEKQAERAIQDTLDDAYARGQGVGVTMMQCARAVLCNGLGRYEDALVSAREAASDPLELGPTKWALAEVVEAGVRTGNRDLAAQAFEQLSEMTRASGTEFALGTAAAMGALLGEGNDAEALHREAIARLGTTRMRVVRARAQLRYGEWLRRAGRRIDARAQLRVAHEALTVMGAEAFAERAGRELRATGETVRKRTVETFSELTAQEAHVAKLAADGLTNPEIAAALYISARTVEWHLRKIFAKLAVTSRRELRRSLHDDELHDDDHGRRSAARPGAAATRT